ncbi:alpha/beta hydrolase [Nostoc sp. 'Peltigera membranacea cyanobiont' 210A]|uniref:alpha/beta fold hydrolase n=1 Tax=Nostoc sp. 'Peltigera membranacea cyanobiont' 210A TaxID=2014529 RepID=UPI000B956B00|nr:alpha/beta hydrolase [Nostoc sp. 'Peltigera membranacea cyanobiont' 210A]OYD94918.1 alpha/beta hydrolase [Nostoc sp. 'Peltigera membranacea cyanobiont' 210A]
MSTNVLSTSAAIGFGGVVQEYLWNWENQELRVVYETLGKGSPLLLLPSFSSVSTRLEVGELAKLLAPYFQVVAIDWPGFGESSRPSLNYRPEIYQQFLEDFVKAVFNTCITVVAAGHAASYVLQLAVKQPATFSRILLLAPTWRGPLPTMGASQQIAGFVRELVRSPILGQALYKLNTTPSFLSLMYRRHVFTDAAKITPSFIEKKWHTTQQPGARFASAAFVTGNLDAVHEQSDFLGLVQSLNVPLMVVIGESSPPKSREEMNALAALPGVRSFVIPGSLGLHEEYPTVVLEAVQDFLFSPEN